MTSNYELWLAVQIWASGGGGECSEAEIARLAAWHGLAAEAGDEAQAPQESEHKHDAVEALASRRRR